MKTWMKAAMIPVLFFSYWVYRTYELFRSVIITDLHYIQANQARVDGAITCLKLAGAGFLALLVAVGLLGSIAYGAYWYLKNVYMLRLPHPFKALSRRVRRVKSHA